MREYINKKSYTKNEYLIWVICIFVIGFTLGMLTIIKIGFSAGIISGSSMENTLTAGSKTLYVSADFKQIKRGDIIDFYAYNHKDLINVIKRVIALPGDTISINGDKVYVNGELLDEPYATYTYPSEDNINVTLKENEYFVMGDNRSFSGDSRYFGAIPKKNILGVLIKSKPPK